MQYEICESCGANLDRGEICDCIGISDREKKSGSPDRHRVEPQGKRGNNTNPFDEIIPQKRAKVKRELTTD